MRFKKKKVEPVTATMSEAEKIVKEELKDILKGYRTHSTIDLHSIYRSSCDNICEQIENTFIDDVMASRLTEATRLLWIFKCANGSRYGRIKRTNDFVDALDSLRNGANEKELVAALREKFKQLKNR